MNVSSTATLQNVIDSTLPQDMKPELEVQITAEGFKPAMEKGALKRWPEEFYTTFLEIIKNDLLPIYNQRITNRTFATKHKTENLVCFP